MKGGRNRADLYALVLDTLHMLPNGCAFRCGHGIELGNVRLVGGKLRCRCCLNAASKRSYAKSPVPVLVSSELP